MENQIFYKKSKSLILLDGEFYLLDVHNRITYNVKVNTKFNLRYVIICLSLTDDESYGEIFLYDGRFDTMSDEELDESCLMEDTYRVVASTKIIDGVPRINKNKIKKDTDIVEIEMNHPHDECIFNLTDKTFIRTPKLKNNFVIINKVV